MHECLLRYFENLFTSVILVTDQGCAYVVGEMLDEKIDEKYCVVFFRVGKVFILSELVFEVSRFIQDGGCFLFFEFKCLSILRSFGGVF